MGEGREVYASLNVVGRVNRVSVRKRRGMEGTLEAKMQENGEEIFRRRSYGN